MQFTVAKPTLRFNLKALPPPGAVFTSTDPAQSFCAETFFVRFRLFRWFALLFLPSHGRLGYGEALIVDLTKEQNDI